MKLVQLVVMCLNVQFCKNGWSGTLAILSGCPVFEVHLPVRRMSTVEALIMKVVQCIVICLGAKVARVASLLIWPYDLGPKPLPVLVAVFEEQ